MVAGQARRGFDQVLARGLSLGVLLAITGLAGLVIHDLIERLP